MRKRLRSCFHYKIFADSRCMASLRKKQKQRNNWICLVCEEASARCVSVHLRSTFMPKLARAWEEERVLDARRHEELAVSH